MQKIIKFSILTAVLTIAITGCKKNEEPTNCKYEDLTTCITPALGWEKRNIECENAYYDVNAHGTGSAIYLYKVDAGKVCTVDEYVASARNDWERDKDKFEGTGFNELNDIEFSAISYTKVGGVDAFEYIKTYTISGKYPTPFITYMKVRCIGIIVGTIVYSIDCMTKESDYDTVAADFQSMIDSYRLK